METLEVTLQQHTPLIHFQHYQDGATLRASEVKPRLDKFLIGNDAFNKWKQYLVGALHLSDKQMKMEAKTEDEIKRIKEYVGKREKTLEQKFNDGFRGLDYKLTILPSSEKVSYDDNDDAMCMYFANQGTVEKKQGILYEDDVVLRFTSQHSGLIKIIEQRFPVFLSKTNFGSRQTKGYGCFFIKEKEDKEKTEDKKQNKDKETPFAILKNAHYSFEVKTTDVNVLFKRISDFYSKLMNGIKKCNIQYNSSERQKKEVARFKSPILFKPIKREGKYIVYIYLSEIPQEMKNENIIIAGKKNNKNIDLINLCASKNYSLIQYFDWIYHQGAGLISPIKLTKIK